MEKLSPCRKLMGIRIDKSEKKCVKKKNWEQNDNKKRRVSVWNKNEALHQWENSSCKKMEKKTQPENKEKIQREKKASTKEFFGLKQNTSLLKFHCCEKIRGYWRVLSEEFIEFFSLFRLFQEQMLLSLNNQHTLEVPLSQWEANRKL